LISLSKEEIHRYAMSKSGDWNEQLNDYCPTSGYPMDLMIGKLVEKGLSIEELKHLEKLSDPKILAYIPLPRRNQLAKNNIHDLIFYLETWLELLENQWLESNSHLSIDAKKKNIPVQVFA
jgi:hypothetical protein